MLGAVENLVERNQGVCRASENFVAGVRSERQKREFGRVEPHKRRVFENYRMQRIKRFETLFTPSKLRHDFSEIAVDIMKQRFGLPLFGKDIGVNNFIEMFLVKIINQKSSCNRDVYSVRAGNIIVESDADENV